MGVEVTEERIHRKCNSPLDDMHQGDLEVFGLSPYDVAIYGSQFQDYVVRDGVVPPEVSQFLRGIDETPEETHSF